MNDFLPPNTKALMKPPEAKQWHLRDRDIHRVLHTYSRRRMAMHWLLRPPRNYLALWYKNYDHTLSVCAHPLFITG